MKRLSLFFAIVFLISFLARPSLGAGWFWDVSNGLGFAAFAGLLYLSIARSSGWRLASHQSLGFAVLGVTLCHVLWLLLGDTLVWEYVKPGAPAYMWSGLASLILLALLVVTALPAPRNRVHKSYAVFKKSHGLLAIVLLAGTAYHIIGSGFYLSRWYQAVSVIALLVVVCVWQRFYPPVRYINSGSASVFIGVSILSAVLFAGVRNVVF